MGEFVVENKKIVVPGELIAKGMDCIPSFGTYRQGENIYSSLLGLINITGNVAKIMPMTGVYMPKKNDVVIGQVIDVLVSGWRVQLNSAYSGMLSLKDGTSDFVARGADLTKYFNLGDYMMTSINNVTSQKLVDLTMRGPGLKKLSGGRILKVNCHKVPRIIGKQGSMVSMIKNATNCKILVGQNGLIWLNGDPKDEVIAVDAINIILKKAHVPGLTDEIKIFLEKQTGKKVEIPPPQPENQNEDSSRDNNTNNGFQRRDSPRREFQKRNFSQGGFRRRE
jgi:exosome complex component RRP4